MKTTEIIYKLREAADILRSIPHQHNSVSENIRDAILSIEDALEEAEEGAE